MARRKREEQERPEGDGQNMERSQVMDSDSDISWPSTMREKEETEMGEDEAPSPPCLSSERKFRCDLKWKLDNEVGWTREVEMKMQEGLLPRGLWRVHRPMFAERQSGLVPRCFCPLIEGCMISSIYMYMYVSGGRRVQCKRDGGSGP